MHPISQTPVRTAQRLKICHLVATTEGATWMLEQLRELRDQYGFEVVAVVSGEKGSLNDKLDAENIRYHVANFTGMRKSLKALLQTPGAVLKLARFFRRERFDVVQTHIFVTMLTGRPAAWLADVPVRTAMIASPFHLGTYTFRWIERLTYWMDTVLIPSCEFSVSLCRELGIPEKRISPVIYYSPDERRFDPEKELPANIRAEFDWPPHTPVVCMVAYFYPRLPRGRWVPEATKGRGLKGHDDLIRAVPTVLREFPNAKFLLVGSGWGTAGEAHLAELRELVRSMGLDETVIFAGYRADVNRILLEANVAVQASLDENLGGTIEALLMQCPTVVTRVGGLIDSVRDGQTGIVVAPSNPADLARGILELLRDPDRGRMLGRAGRQLMLERFTLGRTVSDLAELYDELVTREKAKRKFYNPFVSGWRLILALPIFSFLACRAVFIDIILARYLEAYQLRCSARILSRQSFGVDGTRTGTSGDGTREASP